MSFLPVNREASISHSASIMAAATRQRSIPRPAAMAREQALSRISGEKSSAFWQQLTPMPTIAQSTPPAAFSPISVRIPANFCFPQTRSFVHLMPGRSPAAHSTARHMAAATAQVRCISS